MQATTAVNATASNLTNVERHAGSRVATLQATAKILGQSRLETQVRFDPLENQGDFTFDLRVSDVDPIRANRLAGAHAGLDLSSGHGDCNMQLQAKDGQLNGYAKPLLHDLQTFSSKQDPQQDQKKLLPLAWEVLAQGVTGLFKNHTKDQLATRMPLSGCIDDNKLGTFSAIVGVNHDAVVRADSSRLENLKLASRAAGK